MAANPDEAVDSFPLYSRSSNWQRLPGDAFQGKHETYVDSKSHLEDSNQF